MQIFGALMLLMLDAVTAGVALLASAFAERGLGFRPWRHLCRAVGAAAGVMGGVVFELVVVLIWSEFGIEVVHAEAGMLLVLVVLSPVATAVIGAWIAVPLVGVANALVGWLARQVDLGDAAH